MDRVELATLLNHLAPTDRLAFHEWVCKYSFIPNCHIRPHVQPETIKLASEARGCDRASERLTMDIIMDLSYLATNFAMDLDQCIDELVRRAKGKEQRD
jgi:hypothetical protein